MSDVRYCEPDVRFDAYWPADVAREFPNSDRLRAGIEAIAFVLSKSADELQSEFLARPLAMEDRESALDLFLDYIPDLEVFCELALSRIEKAKRRADGIVMQQRLDAQTQDRAAEYAQRIGLAPEQWRAIRSRFRKPSDADCWMTSLVISGWNGELTADAQESAAM